MYAAEASLHHLDYHFQHIDQYVKTTQYRRLWQFGLDIVIDVLYLYLIQNGQTKLVNVKNQDGMTKILDMVPDIVSRFSKGKNDDLNLDDVKVDEAEDDKQD